MRPAIALLLVSLVSALAACIPVPTPSVSSIEELPAADLAPLNSDEALAVVAEDEEDSLYLARCLQEDLAERLPGHRVLAMQEARDVLFPWLEPGTVPKDDATLAPLLAQPAVTAKLRDLRLRFLIEIDLVSETAAQGYITDRIAARVVDLAAGCCRPGGMARASGMEPNFVPLPFSPVFFSMPQHAACHRLGAALAEALQPRASRR